MQDLIINLIQQFGYLGIFLLIVTENVFPPIPSEIILTFGGFMTTRTDLTVIGVILAATMGSLLGAVILYWFGTIISFERIENFAGKYGKFIGLKTTDMEKAIEFYKKYENRAVFFGRLVPVVRSLISLPAGMAKMSLKHFVLLTTLGSFIWNGVLVMAGHILGQEWQNILGYLDMYQSFTYVVIGLGLILGILVYRQRQTKNNSQN
jgi:membrane protein DedA with SNARE-associated domain